VQDGAEVEQAVDDLRNQARESGLSTFAPGESCNVCYAARGNSFVVRANGDLAKCTVALSSPENRVGRLSEVGRLELDSVKMGGWLRGLFSGDAKQLRCPRNGYAQPFAAGLTTHEAQPAASPFWIRIQRCLWIFSSSLTACTPRDLHSERIQLKLCRTIPGSSPS